MATFVGGVANLIAIVGIPIRSAIAAARVHALGGQNAQTVLSGVRLAIMVNTGLCVVAAILLGLFLRPAGQASR